LSKRVASISPNLIIGIVISFILIAIFMPLGLQYLASMSIPTEMETVGTLLTTVVPIIAVISIVLLMLPKQKGGA